MILDLGLEATNLIHM